MLSEASFHWSPTQRKLIQFLSQANAGNLSRAVPVSVWRDLEFPPRRRLLGDLFDEPDRTK